ncbi:hypothetical protein D4R78_08435 [bacterium]|nr:MAG: hypothetical protein D4R78_08435 [bacterium]
MGLLLNELITVVLLLALGLGYIVFYLANREEKGLKLIGISIGAFMIVFSILLILGNAIFMNMGYSGCAKRRGRSDKEMLMRKQMLMHQQMMKQMQASPAAQAPATKR